MIKNKKITYILFTIFLIVLILLLVKYRPVATPVKITTSIIPISDISDPTCNEIENLIEIEHNKINYNCEKDSDCIYVNTGWCGSCVNKDANIESVKKLFNIYNIGIEKDCLPEFECRKFECNKCENNKCVNSYVK